MNPVRFIRSNALALGMVVFVLTNYSFLFLMSRPSKPAATAPELQKTEAKAPPAERITAKDMRDREDRFKETMGEKPQLLSRVALVFLAVMLVGILFNLYLLIRPSKQGPFLVRCYPQNPVDWGLHEVGLVFAFLFFIEAVILIAEILLSPVFHFGRYHRDLFLMLNSLFRDVFVAGFVILLVTRRFRRPVAEIGLTTRHWRRNILTGLVAYWAAIPGLVIVLFALATVAQSFRYEPPPQPVVEIYLKESTEKYLVYFTFFVAIVGPVIEEIFFRGFTYKAFRSRFGVRWAMIGSSAIFALLHMNLIAFLPIFCLGMLLAYLYEKTGSLVPSMAVHMAHNLIMVALTLGFKSLSG